MTKVFDLNGVERDLTWLRERYGTTVVPGAGDMRFVLDEVRVTTGNLICLDHVETAAGAPLVDHAAAFFWTTAPHDITTAEYAAFKTRYKSPVEIQWTNTNGDTAFGIGPGSFGTPANPPGHATWILHHAYESDVAVGVGWLAMTDHEGALRYKFVLRQVSVPPPPDPEPEPESSDVVTQLKRIANTLDRLVDHLGA